MRRLLAWMVIVLLFLNTVAVYAEEATGAKADKTKVGINDIKGLEFEKEINFMTALDIIKGFDDGTFKADINITRAEFISIIMKVLGVEVVGKGGGNTLSFTDVQGHWAEEYIKFAVDAGIISGYGKEKFGPDDFVTYEQAIKMIVTALGYNIEAEQKGNYPTGYMMVASEKKITKDVEESLGEPVNRGTAAKLVYNALFVDMMKKTGFGSDQQYTVVKDKTLLSERLKIEKKQGKVTANYMTGLTFSEVSLKEDEVQINGNVYHAGNTNAKELLGYSVTCYVKTNDDGDEGTIVFIELQEGKNTAITVMSSDIVSTENLNFTYYPDKEKNDKPKKVSISEKAPLILNGIYFDKASVVNPNILKPTNGEVTLLDSDNDNKYDEVFVTDYEIILLDRVSLLDKKIFSKNKSDVLELDTEGTGLKVVIKKGNDIVGIDSLKEWDVLSVAKSANISGDKCVQISVSPYQSIKGKVNEVGDEDVTIDDKKFRKSPLFNGNLDVDQDGTFYFDIYNKVVAVDSKRSVTQYGYLLGAIRPGGIGNVEVKIFTVDQKIERYKIGKKVLLNGRSVDKQEDILKGFSAADGKVVQQVVLYEINDSGEVRDIHTSVTGQRDEPSLIQPSFTTLSRRKFSKTSGFSNSSSAFLIASDAIIFDISSTQEKKFQIKGVDDMKNSTYYTCEAYKVSEFDEAGIIVIKPVGTTAGITSTSTGYWSTNVTIIANVTKGIDQDGEYVIYITGYFGGKEVKRWTYDIPGNATLVGQFQAGDVWLIESDNDDGRMTTANQLYDSTNKTQGTYRIKRTGDEECDLTYGNVYNINKSIVMVSVASDDFFSRSGQSARYAFKIDSATKVYEFDSSKNKVVPRNIVDIYKGNKVFVRRKYGVTNDILIIK